MSAVPPSAGPPSTGPAALRAAAFGGRPDLSVFGATGDDVPARDRWLAAVVLGGQGRYAAASAVLRRLVTGSDPVVAALAASTVASHLRQIGGHAQARRFDAAALHRLAADRPRETDCRTNGVDRTNRIDRMDGTDWAGARVDALLGLSADAIGLGRVGEAARLHDAAVAATAIAAQARRPVDPDNPKGSDESQGVGGQSSVPWRVTVRVEWLATEVRLAAGRPGDAVPHAERAVAIAEAEGAVRHSVKSTMMLGAALAAGGTPDGRSRAVGLLTGVLKASLRWGMFPLAWPSALLLADLVPERAAERTSVASEALTRIFSWSEASMQRIAVASPWMPTALIRSGGPTRTGVELTT